MFNKKFMHKVNVLRIIAMQGKIGERRRVFCVHSLKSLIRISRPLHSRVQWAWRLFLFSLYSKLFMERVANFLFSFPLLLFYSNSFRRRVLLPTPTWGKKGIYQQRLIHVNFSLHCPILKRKLYHYPE